MAMFYLVWCVSFFPDKVSERLCGIMFFTAIVTDVIWFHNLWRII